MTTVWGAPLVAYQLAGEIAAGKRDEAGRVWESLTIREKTDVVTALGAQARHAKRFFGGAPPEYADLQLPDGAPGCARQCAEAAYLGHGCPAEACGRCLTATARMLIDLEIRIGTARGYPLAYLAAAWRRLAGRQG